MVLKKIYTPLIMVFLSIVSCNPTKHLTKAQKTPIDLNIVIGELKTQYEEAVKSLETENINLQISEVSAAIKVTNMTTVGPELQVLIFKVSHKQKVAKSSSLIFDLKLAKPVAEKTPGLAIQPLTAFIISAAEKFNELSEKPIGNLQKDNFEIDLAFIIERDESGAISIIPTSTFGISGENDHSVEHDMKLVFTITP